MIGSTAILSVTGAFVGTLDKALVATGVAAGPQAGSNALRTNKRTAEKSEKRKWRMELGFP
jgi:hypothetical protein